MNTIGGFISRQRKSVLLLMVILMLVSYQLQGLRGDGDGPLPIGSISFRGRTSPQSILLDDSDYSDDQQSGLCMVGKVKHWGGNKVRPIVMPTQKALRDFKADSADKMTASNLSLLPLFGTRDLFGEVGSDHFTFQGQRLPLPIGTKIQNSTSSIVALDPIGGILRTVSRSKSSKHCVTFEDVWYAHADHTGLVVRDMKVSSSGPEVTVELEQFIMLQDFTEKTNYTDNKPWINVWAAELSNGDTVILIHSDSPVSITVPQEGTKSLTLALYAKIVKSDDDLEYETIAAVQYFDRIAGHTHNSVLLKTHEAAWGSLWPQKLIMIGPATEHLVTMRSTFYMAIYFMLTGRHALADVAIPGSQGDVAIGCFKGKLLRTASKWPQLPNNVDALPAYLSHWVTELVKGGCSVEQSGSGAANGVEIDPSIVIQSMAYAFLGVHVDPEGQTVFISPPKDMPEMVSAEIDSVLFNHHKVQLDLSYKQLNVTRRDMLSEHLYTSAHNDEIMELDHFGTRKVKPLNGVMISNSKGDIAAHWQQTDNGVHDKDVHIVEVTGKSGWTHGLLTLLVVGVVCFHVLLVYIIYTEYLAPPEPGEVRTSWMQRWKRKPNRHHKSPGRSNSVALTQRQASGL